MLKYLFVSFFITAYLIPTAKAAGINLSLVETLSINMDKSSQKDNFLCLGIIGCTSNKVYGLSLSGGYNRTVGGLNGISLATINVTGGDSAV